MRRPQRCVIQSRSTNHSLQIQDGAEERVRLDVDMDEIDLNMDIDPLSESDSDPDDLCFMNIGKKSE